MYKTDDKKLNVRPLIVFIDGQDRSGKTSVVKEVFRRTGKVHNVLDRGPMSNMVYSKMYNRDIDVSKYLKLFGETTHNIITFYLCPNVRELRKRTIKSEDYKVPLKDIRKHKKAFEEAYKQLKQFPNVYKINNSKLNVEQTVDIIVDKIREIEQTSNKPIITVLVGTFKKGGNKKYERKKYKKKINR